ncbi:hypothetical protein [Polaromonas sp. DSR2-3-2]|uniref:hypothetical protein n=1 Tax=unclassified Polaromonas TaxID=2638319 RepID=UPI003CEBC978
MIRRATDFFDHHGFFKSRAKPLRGFFNGGGKNAAIQKRVLSLPICTGMLGPLFTRHCLVRSHNSLHYEFNSYLHAPVVPEEYFLCMTARKT